MDNDNEPPLPFVLQDHGDVVMMSYRSRDGSWTTLDLGPTDVACEAMAEFLARIDYGDRPYKNWPKDDFSDIYS